MVKLFDLLEEVFGPTKDKGLEFGAPCQVEIYESPLTIHTPTKNGIPSWVYDKMKKLPYDIEGYDLYAVTQESDYYFGLKHNDQFITSIGCRKYHLPKELNPDNKDVLQVLFSWTPEQFRGRGYNSALISGLAQLFAIMVSDSSQSKEAKKSWEKIIKRKPRSVKKYNIMTHTITDESPEDNNEVIYVLLEFCNNRQPNSWMKQHKVFTEGIDE